jgi:hypothetical protein
MSPSDEITLLAAFQCFYNYEVTSEKIASFFYNNQRQPNNMKGIRANTDRKDKIICIWTFKKNILLVRLSLYLFIYLFFLSIIYPCLPFPTYKSIINR